MRYTGPVHFWFQGNSELAQQHIPQARLLLGWVKHVDIDLGQQRFAVRKFTLTNGVDIRAIWGPHGPTLKIWAPEQDNITIYSDNINIDSDNDYDNDPQDILSWPELRTVWEPEGFLITPRSDTNPYGWGFPKREPDTGELIDPPYGTPIEKSEDEHLNQVLINRFANNKYLDKPGYIFGPDDKELDFLVPRNIRLREKVYEEIPKEDLTVLSEELAEDLEDPPPVLVSYLFKENEDDEGVGVVGEVKATWMYENVENAPYGEKIPVEPLEGTARFIPWQPFYRPFIEPYDTVPAVLEGMDDLNAELKTSADFWEWWGTAYMSYVENPALLKGLRYPDTPGFWRGEKVPGDMFPEYGYDPVQYQFDEDGIALIHELESEEWHCHWPEEELYDHPMHEAVFQYTNQLRNGVGEDLLTRPIRGEGNAARMAAAEVALSGLQYHDNETFRPGYTKFVYRKAAIGLAPDSGAENLLIIDALKSRLTGTVSAKAWEGSPTHYVNMVDSAWSSPPGSTSLAVESALATVTETVSTGGLDPAISGREIVQVFTHHDQWLYAGNAYWEGEAGRVGWYGPSCRYASFILDSNWWGILNSAVLIQGRWVYTPFFGPVVGAALRRTPRNEEDPQLTDGELRLVIAALDGYGFRASQDMTLHILSAPLSAVALRSYEEYNETDSKTPFEWEQEAEFSFERHHFAVSSVIFDSTATQALFHYGLPGEDLHDYCYTARSAGGWDHFSPNVGPYTYNPRVPFDSQWMHWRKNQSPHFETLPIESLYATANAEPDNLRYTAVCKGTFTAFYDFNGSERVAAEIEVDDWYEGWRRHDPEPSFNHMRLQRWIVMPSGERVQYQNYDWDSQNGYFRAGSFWAFIEALNVADETVVLSRIDLTTADPVFDSELGVHIYATYGPRKVIEKVIDGEEQQYYESPVVDRAVTATPADRVDTPRDIPHFWSAPNWESDGNSTNIYWWPLWPGYVFHLDHQIIEAGDDSVAVTEEPFLGSPRVSTWIGEFHEDRLRSVYAPNAPSPDTRDTLDNDPSITADRLCAQAYRVAPRFGGMGGFDPDYQYQSQVLRYRGEIVYAAKASKLLGEAAFAARWSTLDLETLTGRTDLDDDIFPVGVI